MEYKENHLTDVEAAVIVRQIVKGVEYLHNLRIVHRDLKLENVLITALDDGARIVITDFGSATYLPKSYNEHHCQRMHSPVGTPGYAAP